MDLFVCDSCGCVDAVDLAYPNGVLTDPTNTQCTECQTGTWHCFFPKEKYKDGFDVVINRPTGIGME